MDLCTLAKVKARLQPGSLSIANDELLTDLIREVSQAAEDYLCRYVEYLHRIEIVKLRPLSRLINLRAFPSDVVTWVKYSSAPSFLDVTGLETSEYHVHAPRGQIEFLNLSHWSDPGFVEVAYRGGMATNTNAFEQSYPRIAGGVINEVINRFNRRKTPEGDVHISTNTVAFGKQLQPLDDFYAALDPHRRIRL